MFCPLLSTTLCLSTVSCGIITCVAERICCRNCGFSLTLSKPVQVLTMSECWSAIWVNLILVIDIDPIVDIAHLIYYPGFTVLSSTQVYSCLNGIFPIMLLSLDLCLIGRSCSHPSSKVSYFSPIPTKLASEIPVLKMIRHILHVLCLYMSEKELQGVFLVQCSQTFHTHINRKESNEDTHQ